MAAGAWALYNSAKKHLCDGSVDLDTNTFRMSLYTSASNCTDIAGLTAIGSVVGEVAVGNGYSVSGKVLAGVTWGQGASAAVMRFDSTVVNWDATGAGISGVKYAVVWQTGASAAAKKLICYSKLSTQAFTVSNGNHLSLTPSGSGYFELK